MGQRGPLPKTTARKRMEGNPGHRRLPTDEPEPRLCDVVPSPPEWLRDYSTACDAWWVIAKELHAAKMLATLDLYVLEMFCVAYGQWRKMLDAIAEEGYTYRVYKDGDLSYAAQTPETTLASKFAADCNRWAKVLGLGPAYRVGLRIGDTGEKSQPTDPIAAMLAGGRGDINPPPRRKVAKKAAAKKTAKPVNRKAAKKSAAKKRSAKTSKPAGGGK